MEKGNLCKNNSNRVWTGAVILIIGLIFLLKNVGVEIPGWVISWHTLLILIGLLVGYKRNFEGGGWLVMVLIGSFFTVRDILDVNLSKYFFAIGFIVMGLFLIFKPKRISSKKWKKKYANFDQVQPMGEESSPIDPELDANDILDSVNVFGGSNQKIYSKNFKGGEVLAVFGGCDVNLSQADFQGTIVLDLIAIFGGVKIIVPSNWEVKSEVTAIFGGIEDKRATLAVLDEPRKVLKLKGVAMFGGVDIRNF
ncbi:putative transmembrane protein [Pedobacter sp. BAL39]|uniref:LiaF transmembrane domain-containing protein n=1 Tax=Pedobacter sp. BAL39 TaxID=391596 RepID=UPI0001559E01|nr:LiaF domain-containing protein [Pedobacter sp. BAL39]EDM36546.1 putative transmembrane protein [Pedobacter sp. BAL39]